MQQRDTSIPDSLRLHPGQQHLTPEQKEEALRFIDERIRTQLSTEPVDEQQAEALLRQAYRVAGLTPLRRIYWLDGPLQLAEAFAPLNRADHVRANIRATIRGHKKVGVGYDLGFKVTEHVRAIIKASVTESLYESVSASVHGRINPSFSPTMWGSVARSMWASTRATLRATVRPGLWISLTDAFYESVKAYRYDVGLLAFYRFFDEYLAPNDLHALAHFNEMVSGYWLCPGVAVMMRRPTLLACDANGHLHSETGRCLEYRDGWGCYAWHGEVSPEKVIRAPETLTRDGLLNEKNQET